MKPINEMTQRELVEHLLTMEDGSIGWMLEQAAIFWEDLNTNKANAYREMAERWWELEDQPIYEEEPFF